jgi:transglutaminase-like putative cysteine protease
MKKRYHRVTRKTILLLTLILSLSTTWLSGFALVNPIELNQDFLKYKLRAPYVANFTHTIQIQNFGTSKATDVQLYVPLVQNQTARYFVIINEVSPTPQQFLEDNGNVYAYWNIETIPAAHSFTVNINYHILAFNVAFLVNPSLVEPYNESSAIYREHTIPEHLIESNNTLIVSTAQNVVGEETNPQEMALRIYEFVVDRLTYEVQLEEQGALWALQNRRGDCSEYAYLFVALSRAVRIPSRVLTGFAFNSDVQSLSNGHMWAEYYLENYGWVPVDAGWNVFDELDGRHFASLLGEFEISETPLYVNYYITYNDGAQLESHQIVQTLRASTEILDKFPFAQAVYDAISEIRSAEVTIEVAEVTGTQLLWNNRLTEAKEILDEADIYLQKAMGAWSNQPDSAIGYAQIARERAEQVQRLLSGAMLETMILIIVIPLIGAAVIFVLLVRRGRSMRENVLR